VRNPMGHEYRTRSYTQSVAAAIPMP
jgi:hypothetical protein